MYLNTLHSRIQIAYSLTWRFFGWAAWALESEASKVFKLRLSRHRGRQSILSGAGKTIQFRNATWLSPPWVRDSNKWYRSLTRWSTFPSQCRYFRGRFLANELPSAVKDTPDLWVNPPKFRSFCAKELTKCVVKLDCKGKACRKHTYALALRPTNVALMLIATLVLFLDHIK